jgi:uncharacterized protein YjbJ (UPF0337 family)
MQFKNIAVLSFVALGQLALANPSIGEDIGNAIDGGINKGGDAADKVGNVFDNAGDDLESAFDNATGEARSWIASVTSEAGGATQAIASVTAAAGSHVNSLSSEMATATGDAKASYSSRISSIEHRASVVTAALAKATEDPDNGSASQNAALGLAAFIGGAVMMINV